MVFGLSPSAPAHAGGTACHATRPHADAPTRAELEALLGDTFAALRQEAFAYCFSILRDPSLAEDAVQSAFVEIHRRIRGGDAQFFAAAPREAVKRNLRWASLKQRRERCQSDHWFTPLDSDPGAPAEGFTAVERRLVVDHILSQLPDHMTEVLRLRAVDGAPDAVSAARLGITIDAFRCRYKRAVSAARAAARGLGIESTAGVLVTVARRRWNGLRARWLRGAERTAATSARLASVAADNVLRATSLDGLTAVALTVLASAVAPVAANPAFMLYPRLAAASAADGTSPRPVGAADGFPDGSSSRQRSAPATVTDSIAPAFSGFPALAAPGSSESAAAETPEDTTFFTATAASSPGASGWIVAMGWGRGCQCGVVFQSQDGGSAWAAAAGPPGNMGSDQRITLPPDYPADPRIFISAPAQVGATSASFSARRFGAPFLLLPVPNGSIAVSPWYDRGDDRIYIAGSTTVWTYSLDTGVLRPVPIAAAISQVDAIAAPAQPLAGGAQLYVLADSTAPNATLAGTMTQSTLFACTSPTTCAMVSTPPLATATSLDLSPAYAADHTLAVAWIDRVAVSHDGGQTFSVSTAPVPGQSLVTPFVSAAAQGTPLVWAISRAGQATSLVRLSIDGAAWQPVLPRAVLGATASGRRVIALLANGGLACSADGGATWAPRCPPQ